ncbi:hypothetical protein CPB84DRAFT_1726739 [Gymnopilus junonius]|uniref:Electron transfer flavoprotein-ubiquinone oxidoreductase n=1 Tax=Gymnopilus junonius TaxID=109634 RepID=A0A9P5NTB2_GYMJU|nr:hypothetical protein CPB84DRAFT_1726739 [Gymnopilus junonius]
MLRCKKPLSFRKHVLLSGRAKSRAFRSSVLRRDEAPFNPASVERAEDEVDVCIVGGGPAGISAAIRLKQLEREKGNEIRVVVLEKGSEIGSHIVSGAVVEPRALNELLPTWQNMSDHPLTQPATSSRMLYLTPSYALPIPHPPQMGNKGNYVVSLSQFTRWLAGIAENEYGVEIYPGFAGAQLLLSEEKDSTDPWGNPARSVQGVITNEVGLTKNFRMKSSFEPGMAFRAKVTLLAEGAHGSLSKQAIGLYNLRKESEQQTYGIGLKEVWRVDPEKHKPGEVIHTLGWPLNSQTYGGGWVYHMDEGLVSLGVVIGLDYKNPWISPYRELQKMKHHPYFRALLSGNSERLAYAARVLNEGGLQSVPKLNFPGGALIGCSAGFVNIAKIKGTHNAMKSGMLAAEAAWDAVHPSESAESQEGTATKATDMAPYDTALRNSWVYEDLWEVRNMRPSFSTSFGMWGGIAYSGIESLLRGKVPWTLKHHSAPAPAYGGAADGKEKDFPVSSLDAHTTEPSSLHTPPVYPPFEAPLSTDLLTSVALTGTNHAEDQPIHLRVVRTAKFVEEVVDKPLSTRNVAIGGGVDGVRAVASEIEAAGAENVAEEETLVGSEAQTRQAHVRVNTEQYAGLLGRACPAGVYEYVEDEDGKAQERGEGWRGKKLVINSQNCIHCKLCDVKVPTQDITWTVPEGGGGPKYTVT